MKIVCEECGSKYSVDDSKVQNKSFKITCKKCGNKIIIDNTKEVADEITTNDPFDSQTNWDDDMPSGMGADMEFDDQATKIMSYEDAMKMENEKKSSNEPIVDSNTEMDFDDEATQIMSSSQAASLNATAAANQPEADWYVHINGQQVGPLTLAQLQLKIKQENLSETANVWKTGMADWSMIKNIPQLASHVVKSAPVDPFGGLDSNVAAFGNDSLLDDNDAESLFNDKQEHPNAASFSNNSSAQSDPFAGSFGGGGLDLKSLIDQEDLEEEDDEEDASSKSKVIDFRDIQGNNNKKIVVQHASFNASTNNSSGSNKGLIIALVAIIVIALGGIGIYIFSKKDTKIAKKETLSNVIISSTPSGALIYLDGSLKDKTGGGIIKIKPGKHKVKLALDNYEIVKDVITVTKNDFTQKYTLKAKPKEITIKTGIVEADITVGNKKLKTNPNGEVTLTIKPASNIAVKVEKDGKVKISTTINIKADGDSEFNLSTLTANNDSNNNTKTNETKIVKKVNNKKSTKRKSTTRNHTKRNHKKVAVIKKHEEDNLDDILGDSTPKHKKKVVSNLPKTLKANQVKPVIMRIYPKVKACGKRASISGKVMVKFRINGSGSVSNIKVGSSGGAAKNCIHSKVRSMRFPKFSGSPIPVTFPFKI